MKILVLHIFNQTEHYNHMLDIQRQYTNYIKSNTNTNLELDVFFISYRENKTNMIEKENDMIYIKSDDMYKENLLGITNKTIKSIEFLIDELNKEYDFVIRTNISTIINYLNLYIVLNEIPKNNIYTGGKLECLRWLDPPAGINEETNNKYNMNGLYYMQGIGIIWSFDVVKKIIENKNKINYNIVDDVTFGLFIRDNLQEIYNNIPYQYYAKVSNSYETDSTFIRLKTIHNRMNDVINMVNFTNKILNNIFNKNN